MISTLKGGIEPSELGATLTHEHIFVLNAELVVNYPSRFPDDDLVDRAVRYLDEVKASGIDTIVDLTVMGTGRNIPLVTRVAERSEVNVIVATGWYTYHEAPAFANLNGPGRLLGGPDPLTEIFVRDIVEGIDDTGVKAGVLKFATDHYGITDGVFYIMQAVADAHLETGAPVFTHSDPKQRNGLDQQDYMEKRGLDLTRVVIGHSGDTGDIDYLRRVADRGSFLGMDRFGLEARLPYDERIDTVARMCELGYASQLLLSTDSSAYSMNFPDEARQERLPRWRAPEVMNSVVPDLRTRGVSDADIHAMVAGNAVRVLDPAQRSQE
ncbi:phosphotriesterase family protein [Dietzia natronolimnaea]|uniref:phosphotriesterase family protein n=1 Tax=Dietzia natronolimnaea TaxID=161920 RepID=UPI0015F7B405|nr:phosphotriesterase-related protein [Dietzia natronolimnaea]MBB1037684.1 phosphotriesterase-related protein [Dietzia natronolimnaea]